MKYSLNEESLADLILCEPITKKGNRELERLGLSKNEISKKYFFENLHVSSQYKGDYISEGRDDDEGDEDDNKKAEEFQNIKDEYEDFRNRMTSNKQNQSPLFILGVAGNGKSIEVNNALYNHFEHGESVNQVYIDFEDSPSSKLTYVYEFPIPIQDNILWIFCSKIMESIMEFINESENKCTLIRKTFFEDVFSLRVTDKHKDLFEAIGDYRHTDRDSVKKVFKLLTGFVQSDSSDSVSKNEIINGMQSLIKILLWLMYCSDRKKMNYIIFDNIESYIFLNNNCIQILDDDIKDICLSIRFVTDNVIREFNSHMGGNQASDSLGWKRFKVILVARRTSLGIINEMVLHRPRLRMKNIVDLTGHFKLSDIWKNKKSFVWEKFLKEKFIASDPQCESIIDLADFIIIVSRKAKGKSYQSLIAPLMSYGIRRNAYAQARAIFYMHKQLVKETGFSIRYSQFDLLRKANMSYQARFMVRRALIESHFRWSFTNKNSRERWESLGIGNLKYNKKGEIIFHTTKSSRIEFAPVSYKDPKNITLMHRILSCLSNYPDFSTGVSKPVDLMFSTVSLYNLLNDVFIGQKEPHALTKQELKPFAHILISLCDMSNDETKGAPFAILGIKDNDFHKYPSAEKLAGILEKIYEAGEDESIDDGKYNAIDYGVRLTDAGYSFLSKWMASFSFIESLYCYPLPSLFYLNRYDEIEFVISKVYRSANYLRVVYENEALEFCNNTQKFFSGNYFFTDNDRIVTYRDQMCREHINFLNQYKGYILENHNIIGINEEASASIKELVETHIGYYERWNNERRSPVCF